LSPNDRDRARDKRRYEKRQNVLAMREVEARRNKQVAGVVLAMVVVIGGLVGLSLALNKDTGTNTATPLASQSATTPDGQPSASAPSETSAAAKNVVAGCVTPPKVPTEKRTGTLPDKATAAGKTFVATVTTSCGVITMELDGTKAPQTVASFLGLAKGGYWADSPCHRLTTAGIFVLQCGDPTGTGSGDPGYGYGVENAPADFTYAPGTLAMARTQDPKSNGGQFFIVYQKTVLQDAVGYSIFGKITSGMGIVDKIAAAGANPADASGNTAPVQPISILKVDVAEKKA
jgi:peptidyl-prolyl cis-trans isomerase B (cyclophilin B)